MQFNNYQRYTLPISLQERLNRLAIDAAKNLGFYPEDPAGASDSYRFPKHLQRLPIRLYVSEFDTPSHIYTKILNYAWNKHLQATRAERRALYFLAEQYKQKVEEMIDVDRQAPPGPGL